MGSRDVRSVRALPRAFVLGLPNPIGDPFELPKEEYDKFHKVLRLGSGDQVAILPGDGRLIRCELEGRGVRPLETVWPDTESAVRVELALAFPRPEKLEESVRMATEMGVVHFIVFPSDRTVVRWDDEKVKTRVERLERIAREAAEVSFRTALPTFEQRTSLADVLSSRPESVVLSEVQSVGKTLTSIDGSAVTLVIGPEGGWSPREVELIGDRAATLGPRVLRVDTAVAAACSIVLLR